MTIVLFGEARQANIYYRLGWDSDAQVIYVEMDDERVVYVPGFEYARAQEEVVSGVRVEKLNGYKDILQNIAGDVVVDFSFPYALAKHLLGEVEVRREVFAEQRIKKPQEIALLAKAQELAKRAYRLVEAQLREVEIRDGVAYAHGEELTSEQLKALVRSFLIQEGADCPELIISSGSQTNKPHHRGSGALQEGPVIVDIFPKASNRYHGDLTRTYLLGEHAQAQEMLEAVQEVQQACIKKCVAGQSIPALHEYAQTQLAKKGFSTNKELTQGLVHSLGHGIGLAIHEAPNISWRTQGVLEEGMVVTIEPGLYYDVGVRWEDAVVVGKEPRVL